MSSLRRMIGAGLVVVGLFLTSAPLARAADADEAKLPAEVREAIKLAAQIDKIVAARWAQRGVKPSRPTGDGEFLRRAHLDLTGRIPRPSDLLDFRDRYGAYGREQWINRELLNSDEYVNHFATTWRQLMVPPDNAMMGQVFSVPMEGWLKQKFKENAHYDSMARELIASPTTQGQVTQVFFQAHQNKAEEIGAATSRLFLGVKIECAQCHDHPFARWTRKQFWEYAAFYSGIQQGRDDTYKREILISGTERLVQARFLDGTEPVWKRDWKGDAKAGKGDDAGDWKGEGKSTGPRYGAPKGAMSDPVAVVKGSGRVRPGDIGRVRGEGRVEVDETTTREKLANWMLKSDNQFFAKAAVNRFWAHFFGIGLVEPVDDLSDQNPPSHPELLDLLAKEFVAHDYDVKYLIRAITFSKTYQLSSGSPEGKEKEKYDPRLFARMNLKGLTGEQLHDSIMIATDTSIAAPARNMGFGQVNDARGDFVNRFAKQDNRTEYHTSILQALTMMNGKIIEDATNPEKCNTLKKIIEEPLTTSQRVESIYMAILTRKPRPEELRHFTKYVDSGGPKKDSKQALGDVFWALLNSGEFLLNH